MMSIRIISLAVIAHVTNGMHPLRGWIYICTSMNRRRLENFRYFFLLSTQHTLHTLRGDCSETESEPMRGGSG